MVELAAIGPEAGEAGAPLCESIPLELPLVVLLEGVRMLVFFSDWGYVLPGDPSVGCG